MEQIDLSEACISGMVERGNQYIVTYSSYVGDIYRANALARSMSDEIWASNKDFKYGASIPPSEWLELEKLGLTKDHQLLTAAIECRPEWKTTTKKIAYKPVPEWVRRIMDKTRETSIQGDIWQEKKR